MQQHPRLHRGSYPKVFAGRLDVDRIESRTQRHEMARLGGSRKARSGWVVVYAAIDSDAGGRRTSCCTKVDRYGDIERQWVAMPDSA